MRERMDDLLARFGTPAVLFSQGREQRVRALLQRLRNKSAAPPWTPTPLGESDDRRWLYIGPAEGTLSAGDRLESDATVYHVLDSHCVCVGQRAIYCWAILRKEGQAAV